MTVPATAAKVKVSTIIEKSFFITNLLGAIKVTTMLGILPPYPPFRMGNIQVFGYQNNRGNDGREKNLSDLSNPPSNSRVQCKKGIVDA